MQIAGLGAGAVMMPAFPIMGKEIPVEALLEPGMDVAAKKQIADVALNAAKNAGASYADARIGRYLNQYVFTREDKVQNVVNTESFGIGIRVIANGTWGFSSTNDVSPEGVKKATDIAVSIAKANSKIQKIRYSQHFAPYPLW
jgi:TldD protein